MVIVTIFKNKIFKVLDNATEASPGVLKTLKGFIVGNQEDTSARDKKQAEAEARERKVELAEENYKTNKTNRHNKLTKATDDFNTSKSSNKEEKERKMKRALDEKIDKNKRAISDRDSKIEDVKACWIKE